MNGKESQPSFTDENSNNGPYQSDSITNFAIKALSNKSADTRGYAKSTSEDLSKKGGLAEKISALLNEEPPQKTKMRARSEIICGKDHIENQRIDLVDQRDMGLVMLSFKLKKSDIDSFFGSQKAEANKAEHQAKFINYTIGGNGYRYLADAFSFTKGGMKVYVAPPNCRIRSALGLVRIEAPSDMPPSNIEHEVGQILSESFGIDNALDPPTEEELRNYKYARYAWQHKINGNLSDSESENAENLKYEEVYPGYTTLIEPGIHEKYLGLSCKDARATHMLGWADAETIASLLTYGLASLSERHMRGSLRGNTSMQEDFWSGGADNAFTTTGTEISRKFRCHGPTIVFKPELFDRTDWYSYSKDNFGRTDEEDFVRRLSPEELFLNNCDACNENMFRTGIGPQYIEQIIVDETEDKEELISELKEIGITNFDGKTIEEIIVAREELPIISEEKIERIRSGTEVFPFKDIYYAASNCDLGKTLEIMKPLITEKNIDKCKTIIINTIQQEFNKWLLKDIKEVGFENTDLLDDGGKQFFSYLQNNLGIDLKTIITPSLLEVINI